MGRLEGKVAMVTGAARGMGRSHALAFAREGANVVLCDIAQQMGTIEYALATSDDLAETVRLVEGIGRRAHAAIADVRSEVQLGEAVRGGIAAFGRIDVLVANAGIVGYAPAHTLTETEWDETVDIDLKGAWLSAKVVIPQMLERNEGGSIIFISSEAGLRGFPEAAHYCAAKHGLVGLMRAMALELAPHRIRCNTVHPGATATPQALNKMHFRRMTGREDADLEDALPAFRAVPALPVDWVEPEDVSNACVWLSSDEARNVTGICLTVDAGQMLK